MSEIVEKITQNILSNSDFVKDRESLFIGYVNFLSSNPKAFDKSLVKRLLTTIQYFCKSSDVNIRKEGAVLLAMLLDVSSKEYPDIIPIAKNIFCESGDFPNISLLGKRYPEVKFDLGFYTNAKFDFKMNLNSVKELDFPLTDFQRLLWNNLESDEDVITIAPTSAGKTHIILTYLVREVVNSIGSFAAIVVPTRALISEVSSKVYEIAKGMDQHEEIEICTIPRDDKEFNEKTIFVMTQERLYELIQRGDLSFNYLFIDEAHNISDKSRGVLLHLTLEKLLEDSLPQIIISMPSESYQNAFTSVFEDIDFHKEITRHSPVSKILMSVKLSGRSIEISRRNSDHIVKIAKNFTGKKLADIVIRLGGGQSNIIYRNKTNYCEDVARDISSRIDEFEVTESLEEAADYIEQFIHEDFTLASNLRKGVAFHYGPLPSSVRVMIESLAKDGEIKYIVCTSTLAEGVNLPAKNLFLQNPIQSVIGQPSERLEDVKINNITGRAGRMLEHFSGNVFLIEPDDWTFKDYFEDEEENNKIPTYYKTLNEELSDVIKALSGTYPHYESDQYRFYTIANKLIREFSNDGLENTINSKELDLDSPSVDFLVESVDRAFRSLKVAPFTLEANPTVGYIQQNKLFSFLETIENFDDWVLPHPKSPELYNSLKKVASKLNELGVYINSDEYSIDYITFISSKWISGKSLKEIISDQINWDRENLGTSNVNKSVRNVIKVINNDVRFRLRNAISCYHLLLTNKMRQKSIDKISVKLHNYLEIGACDEKMVSLINIGLSREAAKEVESYLPLGAVDVSIYQLVAMLDSNQLDMLHPITKKEIRTLAG
ncbi:DEAD/DEAH box helicase [Vibrio anguillarum]|uniref:DEAD/DEAH box helicase n=1 Tax=Vibrio anguillarum TaxID=55601 RepID=UPI0002D81962|nr:DEAD/DEAH box helicase [Vibrio anguillarum]OEE41441.1 RNA helicase [Vibrio anguillarum]OEF88572.1 RNA helicase [Vibrio anguillarum]